jgi:hypothetical protein
VLVYSTSGSYGAGVYALITDHLGSVVAVADSTGRLVEVYDYTLFGKTTIRHAYGWTLTESRVGNVLGFTGREMDGDLYSCFAMATAPSGTVNTARRGL